MPCNCGKKAQAKTFVYTSPTGQTQSFASEVQAQAEKIRRGGGTVRSG